MNGREYYAYFKFLKESLYVHRNIKQKRLQYQNRIQEIKCMDMTSDLRFEVGLIDKNLDSSK